MPQPAPPPAPARNALLLAAGNQAIARLAAAARLARQPAPPAAPPTVTRQGGNGASFISTDTITLDAALPPAAAAPDAGTAPAVTWTVNGASVNSGQGKPHTATGTSFAFTPNPSSRPTGGSRSPNPPIKYRVDATAAGATAHFDLEQDEADTIRQEYIDYGVPVPARSTVVAPTIAGYNGGNYTQIVDGGMDAHLASTTAKFAELTQAAAPHPPAPAAGSGSAAPPPAPAPVPAISVESGYRNPQRNKAVGSVLPNSHHVSGTALDLGLASPNATLWARLRKAGGDAGNTSICEIGPTQVECDDPHVNHVHIQW